MACGWMAGPCTFPRCGNWRGGSSPPGRGRTSCSCTSTASCYEKSLLVADGLARRSPVRPPAAFLDQLLEPSEPPVATGGPVTAIRVPYPERTLDVLGFSMHWLVLYLVASFAFVLLLRKPLGVVI